NRAGNPLVREHADGLRVICEFDHIGVTIAGSEHMRLGSSSHGTYVAGCDQKRTGYALWVHDGTPCGMVRPRRIAARQRIACCGFVWKRGIEERGRIRVRERLCLSDSEQVGMASVRRQLRARTLR